MKVKAAVAVIRLLQEVVHTHPTATHRILPTVVDPLDHHQVKVSLLGQEVVADPGKIVIVVDEKDLLAPTRIRRIPVAGAIRTTLIEVETGKMYRRGNRRGMKRRSTRRKQRKLVGSLRKMTPGKHRKKNLRR